MKSNNKITITDSVGFRYEHIIANDKPIGGTQALAATLAYYLSRDKSTKFEIILQTFGNHNYEIDKIKYIGLSNGVTESNFFIIVNYISNEDLRYLKKNFTNSKIVFWWHGNNIEINKYKFIIEGVHKIIMVSQYALSSNKSQDILKKTQIIKNFLPFLPPIFERQKKYHLQKDITNKLDFAYMGNGTRGLQYIPQVADFLDKNKISGKIKIFSGKKLYNPNLNLDNSEKTELIEFLDRHPKVSKIKKIGKCDLIDELRSCRILLSPNTFDESFCLSLIEAMFCNLLVVSTNRSAIPETVNKFGYLGEVENPNTNDKFTNILIDSFFLKLKKAINDSKNLQDINLMQSAYILENFMPKDAIKKWKELFQVL